MSGVDEQATEAAPEAAPAAEPAEAEVAAPAETPKRSWQERIDDVLERNTKAQDSRPEPEPEPEDDAEPDQKVAWDDVITKQPADVQKLMRQLRAESTRRFQEASTLRKQAEAEKAALFDSPMFQQLQQMASQDANIDPFDPKSVDAYIEKKVAERLQSVLQPVHQAHRQAEATQRYEQFMDTHPDLKSDKQLRHAVAGELRNNEAMTLEQAYLVVRGRGALQQQKKSQARQVAERRAARAAALKVSAPPSRANARGKVDTEGRNAWDIYQALQRLQKPGQ